MVKGKKMTNGFLWFWLHSKQPRYNYLIIRLSSSCALQSLVSYKCHLPFYVALQLDTRRILKRLAKLGELQVSFATLCCFTVGHSKNFDKTCKGKSKAVGSMVSTRKLSIY
jgi:hypothetical protein